MVGLGNVWRFPALLLKYGGSGLIAYLISVALLTTLIASVLKVAHVEVGGILEHYERLNFPAFTLFFLVLNVLFLSYYSTVGGLALSSLITSKAPENILWKLLSSLAFILIVFVILMAGKKRVFDIMAISLVAFLVLVSFVIFEMYSYVGNENEILSSFKSLFAVKGFTVEMIADMMAQAAYSLGVGLGFYLIFGSFMPKKASPAIIAVTGAIIDTLASFMGGLSCFYWFRPSFQLPSSQAPA
ncbi:sodium-dependent transporter [Thermococcus peptonophilus]|uniref:sodium-dependent transporter n=1 Tax=Thermococcus peptonophilus TaxID=53952 RepID=UPI0006D10024